MDFLKIASLVFLCSSVFESAEGVKSHRVQEGEWAQDTPIPEVRSTIRDPFRGLPPSFWQSTKEVGWKVFKGLTAFLAVSHSLKMASAQTHVWDNTTACAPFLVNPTALCLDGSMPQQFGQLFCDNVLMGGCQSNVGIFTNATGPSCAENETLSLEGFEDDVALYCNDQRQLQRPCLNTTISASTEIQVILKDGRQFLQCLLGGDPVNIPATLTCPGGGIFGCSGHAIYQIMHRCPDKGDLCHTHAAKSDTTGGVESGSGGAGSLSGFDGRLNGTCSCIPAVWDFSSPCAPTVIPDDPRADPGSINTTSIPLEALCKDGSKPTLHGQLLCDGVVAGTCPQAGDFGIFTPDNPTPRTFCTADETASIGWGTATQTVALYCTDKKGVTTRITSTQCVARLLKTSIDTVAQLVNLDGRTYLQCVHGSSYIGMTFPVNSLLRCPPSDGGTMLIDTIPTVFGGLQNYYHRVIVCSNNAIYSGPLEATRCAWCCRHTFDSGEFFQLDAHFMRSKTSDAWIACDQDHLTDYNTFQINLPIMAVPQPTILSCAEGMSFWCPFDAKTEKYWIFQKCVSIIC